MIWQWALYIRCMLWRLSVSIINERFDYSLRNAMFNNQTLHSLFCKKYPFVISQSLKCRVANSTGSNRLNLISRLGKYGSETRFVAPLLFQVAVLSSSHFFNRSDLVQYPFNDSFYIVDLAYWYEIRYQF